MDKLLKIHQYNFDQPEELKINCNDVDWLKQIFENLESITDTNLGDEKDHLKANLKLIRKSNSILREYFIIQGNIECIYHAACIRCLAPSKQSISVSFTSCFLHSSMENTEEYQNLTEVYCDGKNMDLYFSNKGAINLQELISEQIHLNINHRPLHHEDCKGLCPTCGFNLNFGKCIHQRKEKN